MATKKRHQIRAHGSWINGVAMSRDSKWLLTCSKDRTIRMWNVSDADKMPVVLHNKLSMGYKYTECTDCSRTFKVEQRDLIETGEELTQCVYCRMPARDYYLNAGESAADLKAANADMMQKSPVLQDVAQEAC
eukprot:sb/3474863/